MNAIQRAVDKAGGLQALAGKVGVKYQAVQRWVRSSRVPAERVLAIEAATNGVVSRHELRPDIYPAERQLRRSRLLAVTRND